jgi:hypothetical protein
MKFLLEVEMCDRESERDVAVELGKILRYWGGNLRHYELVPGAGSAIYDSDQNTVGRWRVSKPD